MRLSYSLGSLLTIEQIMGCVKTLQNFHTDVIWIPETWGMENFSLLSYLAQNISKPKIGSSIINIYSRSPAVIAMGAVSIDVISKGRLILGLGTSSQPIVEEFHGAKFEKPLLRMREYVDIINLVISGKKVDYTGKIFSLKNFSLLIKPPRQKIPIYLAAVNEKMVELAWEIADGVIFYLRPLSEMKNTIEKMQAKKKIDTTCQIITCMSNNSEDAFLRAKKTLAFYVSAASIYRNFLKNNGFHNEVENVFDEYKKTGLANNFNLIPDSMVNELTISGTPDECIKQLRRFHETGIDLPIIQFNPIGNVSESFEMLTSTFSEVTF